MPGLMTLAEYQSELRLMLGRDLSTASDIARMNRWVNSAIREFGYAIPFHELEDSVQFVTVDGKYQYEIGPAAPEIPVTGFRAIHELGLQKTAPGDRRGRLIPETRERFLLRAELLDSTSRADPKYYHKFGKYVFLRPVPDSTVVTLTMHIWKTITPLVASGDVSPFHESWDEVILLGATYRGFRAYGQQDRYINAKNDFIAAVRTQITEHDLEQFPEGGLNPINSAVDSEEELSRE